MKHYLKCVQTFSFKKNTSVIIYWTTCYTFPGNCTTVSRIYAIPKFRMSFQCGNHQTWVKFTIRIRKLFSLKRNQLYMSQKPMKVPNGIMQSIKQHANIIWSAQQPFTAFFQNTIRQFLMRSVRLYGTSVSINIFTCVAKCHASCFIRRCFAVCRRCFTVFSLQRDQHEK